MRNRNTVLANKTILVTGSPGFIGANLVMRLLRELTCGQVISFDELNGYWLMESSFNPLPTWQDAGEKIFRKSEALILLKVEKSDGRIE